MRLRIASFYLAILRNAKDPNVRKRVLVAYENIQAKKNSKVLEELLALRYQMAKMLGYKSYAHFVLEDRMARSPENVYKFLETCAKSSLPK